MQLKPSNSNNHNHNHNHKSNQRQRKAVPINLTATSRKPVSSANTLIKQQFQSHNESNHNPRYKTPQCTKYSGSQNANAVSNAHQGSNNGTSNNSSNNSHQKVFYQNMKNQLLHIKQDVEKIISKERIYAGDTATNGADSKVTAGGLSSSTISIGNSSNKGAKTISIKNKCQQQPHKKDSIVSNLSYKGNMGNNILMQALQNANGLGGTNSRNGTYDINGGIQRSRDINSSNTSNMSCSNSTKHIQPLKLEDFFGNGGHQKKHQQQQSKPQQKQQLSSTMSSSITGTSLPLKMRKQSCSYYGTSNIQQQGGVSNNYGHGQVTNGNYNENIHNPSNSANISIANSRVSKMRSKSIHSSPFNQPQTLSHQNQQPHLPQSQYQQYQQNQYQQQYQIQKYKDQLQYSQQGHGKEQAQQQFQIQQLQQNFQKQVTKFQQSISQLREQNQSLQSQVIRLNVQSHEKDKYIQNLREEMLQAEDHFNKNEMELKNSLNQLKHDFFEREKHIQMLQTKNTENARIMAEDSKGRQLEAEAAANVEKVQKQLQVQAGETKKLKEKLKNKENQLYIYQEELKNAKSKIKTLKETIESYEEQENAAVKQTDQTPSPATANFSSQKLQALQSEINKMNDELKFKQSSLTQLTDKLNQSKYKMTTMQQQNYFLKEKVKQLEKRLESTAAEIAEFKANSVAETRKSQLTVPSTSLSIQELLKHDPSFHNIGEELTQKLDIIVTRNYELQNRISRLQAENETLTITNKSLKDEIKFNEERTKNAPSRSIKIEDWDNMSLQCDQLRAAKEKMEERMTEIQQFFNIQEMRQQNEISSLREQINALLENKCEKSVDNLQSCCNGESSYPEIQLIQSQKKVKGLNQLISGFKELLDFKRDAEIKLSSSLLAN